MTSTSQIVNCHVLFTKVGKDFHVAIRCNDVFGTWFATGFKVTHWYVRETTTSQKSKDENELHG